jgi:antitoxin (DNA-binding transcriptional repressor) of toxin-antitoxin stability system
MNNAETLINNTIDLAEFKARCLEILEHLVAPGIILTKEGHPVAKITPLPTVNNEALIGSMKGEISISGDIFSTGVEWDAQS